MNLLLDFVFQLKTIEINVNCKIIKNMRNYCTNTIEEKLIPDWFFSNLLCCDECEKYIAFIDEKCSSYRSHRHLVTCNYCQNDFKTFNN